MTSSTAIADLEENRLVEAVYAVAQKRRLRTRNGSDYLALELVDPSGRINARIWSDVELLDARFTEGDAVRVLGRVERYRDQLQVEVRSLEQAEGVDPADLAPAARRDVGELDGFLDFLAAEVAHEGLVTTLHAFLADDTFRERFRRLPATPDGHHSYAGGLLEHTVGVATLVRESALLHPRLRSDLVLTAGILHDVGRTRELDTGPLFAPTHEGELLGHVQLGLQMIRDRAGGLEADTLAELLHGVATHHDARGHRTAEAAVLYHSNLLDATAATRPVRAPA